MNRVQGHCVVRVRTRTDGDTPDAAGPDRGERARCGAVDNRAAPLMPFDTEDFIKLKPGENLGEVLGVAVNSKGEVAVLNHPGTATTGPLFGNATTEILALRPQRALHPRDRPQGVYGFGYGHSDSLRPLRQSVARRQGHGFGRQVRSRAARC